MTESAFDKRPIGIFDSGLGGLTVVASVRKRMPNENIVYLGDTARVPYGNRSPETIMEFAGQDVDFLLTHRVKAIVIACNTVSATALDVIKKRCPGIPVFGMIQPGVEAVIRSRAKTVLVLGTRATIQSNMYEQEILKRDPDIRISSIACPLFVPLVEEGITDGPLMRNVFDLYLKQMQAVPPDTVLLGCTHYPLLKRAIQDYFGLQTRIADSAAVAAEYVEHSLIQTDALSPAGISGKLELYVTDIASGFQKQAERFLGTTVPAPVCISMK